VIARNIKLVSNKVHVSEMYTGAFFLNTQKKAHARVYVIRGSYNAHAAN